MTKRIVSRATGKLYAVQAELASSSLADFWRWRTEVRNMIDHHRRDSRWWRPFGLQVWLCRDGKLRGIASFGSLTETEVLSAFNRRWPTTLRSIDLPDLRHEIATIVHPNMITSAQVKARYQSISFRLSPQRPLRETPTFQAPAPMRTWIEPMPVVI